MSQQAMRGDRAPAVTAAREPGDPHDAQTVIDQALRLVADHHRGLGAALGRSADPPSLAELRASPLGQDLRLAVAGSGRPARAAADRVVDLLLRPLAADDYTVPAWFWETALGRLLARAERAGRAPDGLLSAAAAAARLGVARAVVEEWLADGGIETVLAADGRPLVPFAAVERRLVVAAEIEGGPRPPADVLLAQSPAAH
jgi:hypothetical protein